MVNKRAGLISIALAALCVATAILWWFASRPAADGDGPSRANPAPASQNRSEAPQTRESASQAVAPSAQAASSAQPSPLAYTSAALVALRSTSRNQRVFVEEAKRRASEGGIFHVLGVLDHCRNLRAAVLGLGNAQLSEAQRLAGDELLRRCADFTDAELASSQILVNKELGRGKDPLLALRDRVMAELRAGLTEESRLRLIQAVLDTNDGYVWDAWLVHLMAYRSDSGARSGALSYYFGGKLNGGLSSSEPYIWGLTAMSCRVAKHCGTDFEHYMALKACFLTGFCSTDYETALVNGSPVGEDEKSKFLALLDDIAAALRSRNARAFMK